MDWLERAACRGMDPEIFFPSQGMDGREAKAICATCPVTQECLDYAESNKERIGVFGGMTAQERNRRRRKLKAMMKAALDV